MPIEAELADGRILEFPDGTDPSVIQATVKRMLSATAPKKEGFGAALGKGFEGITSPIKTAIGAVTGSAEEAALAGLKRAEESPYAEQVSLDKVKQAYERGLLPAAGEVLRQIPLAITEQAPNIAATLGSAKAGSLLGAKVGTAVAPGMGTAVGTIGGGLLGALAPSLLQQFGGNIQRQAQEQLEAKQPLDISKTAAFAAAAPQAGLDVAATLIPLGRTVAGSVLGPQVKQLLEKGAKEGAEKLARESLPTVLAKGAGITVATEAPTEVVQSMLERAQAGLPLLSDDALKEYGEAAYQAALIAPIGSAARVGERSAARQQPLAEGMLPGETERQAAERLQAEIFAMKKVAEPPVPPPPSPALSTTNLYNLMAQPNGYALVEQYKQRLLALPEQTDEIKKALEEASFIQRRSVIESLSRQPTQAILDERRLKQLGFRPQEDAFQALLGKDMASPDQAESINQALSAIKAKEETPANEIVKIDNFLVTLNEFQDAVYPRGADVRQAVTEPSGAGVPVVSQPDTGAPAEGAGAAVTSGVVPAVEDAGQPAGRAETEQPAVVEASPPTAQKIDVAGFLKGPEGETQEQRYTRLVEKQIAFSEAAREGFITPEQNAAYKEELDKSRQWYESTQKERAATLSPESQEALRLADELEKVGKTGMVSGIRLVANRNQVTPQNLEFYRDQLSKAQQAKVEPVTTNYGVDAFFATNQKDKERLDFVRQSAPKEDVNLIDQANQAMLDLAKKAQDLGYGLYDAGAPEAVGKLKSQYSVVAGGVSRLLRAQEATLKNYKKADQERLNKDRAGVLEDIKASNSLVAEIPAEPKDDLVSKKSLADIPATRWGEIERRAKAAKQAAEKAEATPEQQEINKDIEAKIDQLGKVLSRIMGRFGLKDVALKLVEDMKAEGEYSQSVVRLALDAASPVQALRHESIHALKELGFFSPQQWSALEKQAKSKWIDQYLKNVNINKEPLGEGEKSRYDAYMDLYKGDMDAIIEEAIADAFGDFDVNKAPPGMMQAILNRLRQFFDAVRTAFGGEITAEQVFRKVEKGELKAEAAPAETASKQSLRQVPLSTRGLMEVQPIVAMQELGLKTDAVRKPGGIELFNDVRSIALALNQDTIRNHGQIAKTDTSLTSEKELARAMVDEIGYQLRATADTGTGKGWYSDNYPKAVKKLGKLFPELETDPYARTVFSALVAITSNGEKVSLNVKNAIKLYEDIRMGKDPRGIGSRRQKALDNNLAVVLQLMKQYGPTGMRNELLREITVKDMNAILRSRGEKPDTSYLADTKVPAAALYFGPKLGAFFSNLEGAEGYLTMDMWWTRTVNRMRGQLESKATEASIKKFANMMDKPNATREEVVAATIPLRNKYEEFGWHTELEELVGKKEPAEDKDKPAWNAKAKRKAGPAYEALLFEHRLEKMANTIYKNEYELLEEAPFTSTDREFMYRTARRAQSLLKAEGINLSLADIQAALWYYEKRLYQHLSGRKADDIGYDEAITQLARESTGPARPSVVFGGQPVSGAGPAGAGAAATGVGGKPAKLSLRDPIGLYSELENKVAQGPNKAPAASWKAYINGLTQKGVKPEEIEWSGVRDWLDLQTGPVSKDAVNAYLKQGGVKVEEVVLGEKGRKEAKVIAAQDIAESIQAGLGEFNDDAQDMLSRWRSAEEGSRLERQSAASLEEMLRDAGDNRTIEEFIDAGAAQTDSTRYGQWVLPGGENYREVLLTLPTQFKQASKQLEPEIRALGITEDLGDISLSTLRDAGASEDLQRRFDQAMTSISKEYRSTHWEQPNVLAHIRLNDRTDADGNKVLFVEEIQSDWGQEGKKKGFVGDLIPQDTNWQAVDTLDTVSTRAEAEAKLEELQPFLERIREPGMENRLVIREGDGFFDIIEESRSPTATAPRRYGISRAPFVTKTEGWLNLALKRIMVMAAEGGYDKVAFVDGAQSATRYDLSKQIDRIDYNRNGDGTYSLSAIKNSTEVFSKESLTLDEVEDTVGKDIAKKIEAGEGQSVAELDPVDRWEPEDVTAGDFEYDKTPVKSLSGLDLKVGGEGMKAFYNQIVPLAVKKLLPKVGGGKMEDVSLLKDSFKKYDKELMKDDLKALGEEGFRAKYAHDQQPGFAVTPEMKQKVETTGLPRFSLRSSIPTAARQRIVQTTVARDEKTFYQRIIEAISPQSFSSFRSAALNRYNQLGVYDKKLAEQMGGKVLLANTSAEAAALLSDLGAGLTASALGVHDRMGGVPVYKNGITTISNLNNTIKGPVAIFAPLAKQPGDYQAYQYWAAVKRGLRFLYTIDPKTGQPVEKLITAADGPIAEALRKQYLKDFKIDFNAIQEDWIKYNNGLVEYMVATGVLSKERADVYKQYADYLPLYRQMNGEETVGPKIFQAISGVKPPKKYKGGEAPIDDFLENIVRNTQAAIQAGVKNVAAQRAADVAVKIQMADRLQYQSSAPNTFQVLENGKVVTYASQDMLFINAIKSLGLPDLPFIGFLSGPANLLRNLVTKDPGFMLANLMRDSMSAWVTSGVKMTPLVDTISNFGSALAGKDPSFQALMNAGILGGYEFSQNVEQSGREFAAALRKQAKVKQPGMKGVLEMGAKPFTSLWEALEKGSTASDAATRMEVYKKTLAETGNEAEALYRALEVMNFNRKGSSAVVRVLTAAVPFLNARMQGLDVLYRASFGKMNVADAREVQRRFFVRGAMIAALSASYWALTHDEEEYKKQEQETRDNYWLLPSLGIKIPIPFEIGVLFKVIPERILAVTFGSDTGEDFIKSMARQLTSTLAFNPIPQTVLPIVETMTNFSFFTMRPIVGQGLEGIQPAYQIGPGTSRLSEMVGDATKGMAKELQISPMKLDQLISGYTGTMGMYLVNLMDAVYDMNTDSPKPAMRFERMPLIRRFALDPEARGAVTGYYDLKNSVDSIVRTSNMLERTMNYEELPGYLQDNMQMLAVKDYLLDLEKTMKEFREMKILIRSAKMDADVKKDAILSIDQMENQLTANIQYLKSLAKGG